MAPGGIPKACRVRTAVLEDDARTDKAKQPLHLKDQYRVGFHNGLAAHDRQDGRRSLRERGYASLIQPHKPRLRKARGFFSPAGAHREGKAAAWI